MIGFLRWLRRIVVGTFNGLVMLALGIVVIIAVVVVIGLLKGDGLPRSILLTANLRGDMPDSAGSGFDFGPKPASVMATIMALDHAGRDNRVKGLLLRVGNADLSVPQAEELADAVARFRRAGKFVVADAAGFNSSGLGDYLLAASANEIWMQPESPFSPAGAGAGAMFFRGLLDKIQAVPQIVKRADFKSAADTFMEKDYTAPDRLQTTALLKSWYDSATSAAARGRNLTPVKLIAMLEHKPSFAEDAQKAGLIDKIGFSEEAEYAAMERAGSGAEALKLTRYIDAIQANSSFGDGPKLAVVQGAGEIVDGHADPSMLAGNRNVIAGDDFSEAIREAADDPSVRAIILRVDSPGGSVLASDQILHAVKMAQAKGKPVVVSMGRVAASGGYYIASSANKIVAEPGTITGSIGVLTGKISFGKTLAMIGITADQIGVGQNALANSMIAPYTDAELAAVNKEADLFYASFKQKVAAGRKLPLAKVDDIAKGRVWSGADAKAQGLVDTLGGFWTAVAEAKKLAGISEDSRVVFALYPPRESIFDAVSDVFGGSDAALHAAQGLVTIANSPLVRSVAQAVSESPRGKVEMRATGLPLPVQ